MLISCSFLGTQRAKINSVLIIKRLLTAALMLSTRYKNLATRVTKHLPVMVELTKHLSHQKLGARIFDPSAATMLGSYQLSFGFLPRDLLGPCMVLCHSRFQCYGGYGPGSSFGIHFHIAGMCMQSNLSFIGRIRWAIGTSGLRSDVCLGFIEYVKVPDGRHVNRPCYLRWSA